MKKTLILAAVAGMACTASAQIGKGSLMAGLDFGISSNNNQYSYTTGGTTTDGQKGSGSNFNLTPNLQYFLAENLSVGIGFGINNGKSDYDYPESGGVKQKSVYKNNGTQFNLFARKYINCGTNFYTFLQLGYSMGNSKSTNEQSSTVVATNTTTTTTTTSENKNNSIGLNLGFAWSITPKILLQGSIGGLSYNSNTQKYNISADGKNYNTYKSSGLNFSLYSSDYPFNLGFAYRLIGN